MQHLSKSEKDTQELGTSYGKKCRGGELFLLAGELGGGKTQFVKGLAVGLGIAEVVTSPTFNYENIYQGSNSTLYHFDLYRENILDPDIEMILAEALADPRGIVAVEWSERTRKWPKNFIKLAFKWQGEHERMVEINDQIGISNDKA